MIDVIIAGYTARHFGKRAVERGGSRAKTALAVFGTILGGEVAGMVAFAMVTTVDTSSLMIGAVLGFLVGIAAGVSLGGWMTAGPIVARDDEAPDLVGRDCYECQKPIERRGDGRPCGDCRHATHTWCRDEHRIAHREYEAKVAATSSKRAP